MQKRAPKAKNSNKIELNLLAWLGTKRGTNRGANISVLSAAVSAARDAALNMNIELRLRLCSFQWVHV